MKSRRKKTSKNSKIMTSNYVLVFWGAKQSIINPILDRSKNWNSRIISLNTVVSSNLKRKI